MSNEVEEFLARIRQLDEKTDREDELRAKELENEILEGRKRRQALRQAMHSRSNSQVVAEQQIEETIEYLVGKRDKPSPMKPSKEVRSVSGEQIDQKNNIGAIGQAECNEPKVGPSLDKVVEKLDSIATTVKESPKRVEPKPIIELGKVEKGTVARDKRAEPEKPSLAIESIKKKAANKLELEALKEKVEPEKKHVEPVLERRKLADKIENQSEGIVKDKPVSLIKSMSLKERSVIFEKNEVVREKITPPKPKDKPMFLEDSVRFASKPVVLKDKPDFLLARASTIKERTSALKEAETKPLPRMPLKKSDTVKEAAPEKAETKPLPRMPLKTSNTEEAAPEKAEAKPLPRMPLKKSDTTKEAAPQKAVVDSKPQASAILAAVPLKPKPKELTAKTLGDKVAPPPLKSKPEAVKASLQRSDTKFGAATSSYYNSVFKGTLKRTDETKPDILTETWQTNKVSLVRSGTVISSAKPSWESEGSPKRSPGRSSLSPLGESIADDSEFKRIVSAAASKRNNQHSPLSSKSTSRSSSPTRQPLDTSPTQDLSPGSNGHSRTNSKSWASRGQTSWLESALKKNPALEPRHDDSPDFIFERRRSDVRDYDFKLINRSESPIREVVGFSARSESPTRTSPSSAAVARSLSPDRARSTSPMRQGSVLNASPPSKVTQQQQELMQNPAFHQILAGLKRSNTMAHRAPPPIMGHRSPEPVKKSATMPELGGSEPKLNHMTRKRAKGPSRRLPKADTIERARSAPIEQATLPKTRQRPLIRTSSRSVSISKTTSPTTSTSNAPPPKPRKPSSTVCS